MAAPSDALSALGSDLAFSVSYTIAVELRESATEWGLTTNELVTIIFVISMILVTVPTVIEQFFVGPYGSMVARFVSCNNNEPLVSLGNFCKLLLTISQRIAISLLIQLVANSAVAQEGSRGTRVLSLLSVAVFFLFLQSGASFDRSRHATTA